ncbi:MAG: hypothetical protein VW339_02810 [Quisquiliibacterium sp.]
MTALTASINLKANQRALGVDRQRFCRLDSLRRFLLIRTWWLPVLARLAPATATRAATSARATPRAFTTLATGMIRLGGGC